MASYLEFVHASPFYELAALLVLAAAAGIIGLLLKQPMVVSYIAVGILSGPSILGIVRAHDSIEQLSELSIAVLLFVVGMKLDLNKIKTLGTVSLTTGLGQVFFTAFIGFFIIRAFGFDVISSLYIAIALTFSSTIIIVKLLSDKREVDSLHGRIAIGFLFVQDLVVVLALMVLSAFGGEMSPGTLEADVTTKIVYGLLFILVAAFLIFIFVKYLATPLISRIIRSSELLITFAISWAALFAAVCSFFGFSKELGGLMAGISLASTPFRESIVSRLSSLRDFLLLFFFISLGSQMDVANIETQVFPALVLSLFVLFGNPLIVMVIMGYMGYRKRTGFLAGLTVAQISEFSLIFIALGLALGHVTAESLELVTLVGMITIATSIYMIIYSHVLYNWSEPLLGIFERKVPYKEEEFDKQKIAEKEYDVLLFGLGRYGQAMCLHLKRKNLKVLGIDYDPETVRRTRRFGFDTLYGDAWDHELITKLPLENLKWVIAAIPQNEFGIAQEDPRLALLAEFKNVKFKGKIAVSAQFLDEVDGLKEKGADMVFLPFFDAAERAVERIMADKV